MSQKGLLSIGEFSKLTGIPRSKLIYYDEIGLFPAVKRGENNYRYYSLSQIILAGFINDMASFGVSLKELLSLVHDRTPEMMIDILEKSIKEHQEKIAKLKETQSVMNIMSNLMKLGIQARGTDVEVLEYKPHHLILGSENIYQDAATFYPAWISFMNSAQKAGINVRYPVGGYFDSFERFVANPGMPSRYYFVNPRGKLVRGGGKWLAGYVSGFYGTTKDLPQRMMKYAEDHNLELTGPVYNTFLLDEISTVDPESYLMRASIKIVEDESEEKVPLIDEVPRAQEEPAHGEPADDSKTSTHSGKTSRSKKSSHSEKLSEGHSDDLSKDSGHSGESDNYTG